MIPNITLTNKNRALGQQPLPVIEIEDLKFVLKDKVKNKFYFERGEVKVLIFLKDPKMHEVLKVGSSYELIFGMDHKKPLGIAF